MRKAIYPGTFDPVTNGHYEIIERASRLFDHLIVAVAVSTDKNPMFNLDERVKMLKDAIGGFENVEVEPFTTLLVDFAAKKEAFIIIRGLRAVSDFEFELQMGYANASLMPEIETVHLMPSLDNAFISSSVVRSLLRHKGRIGHLVPLNVERFIRDKFCM